MTVRERFGGLDAGCSVASKRKKIDGRIKSRLDSLLKLGDDVLATKTPNGIGGDDYVDGQLSHQ